MVSGSGALSAWQSSGAGGAGSGSAICCDLHALTFVLCCSTEGGQLLLSLAEFWGRWGRQGLYGALFLLQSARL
jgi:hypothetical protein